MKAYKSYSTKKTSQSERIPGREDQVKNNAGGYVFSIDSWTQLDRFLILGSEGGSYYVSERKLTLENAENVHACVLEDGKRTVKRIVEISQEGRATKNDPALFALAICAGLGDLETRRYALENLPKVARTGTHLFNFVSYVTQFRGWGSGLKKAIRKWYSEKDVDHLAHQAVKYRQRNGWSHRDLLRLTHPSTDEKARNSVYKWITQGKVKKSVPDIIKGFEKTKGLEKPDVNLIQDYGLTREMIPTSWLNHADVWEALLENMPLTAMVRNLGKMTNVGLIFPMSEAVKEVVRNLTNEEKLKKARVHPLSLLVALKIYEQGHGMKGKLFWNPNTQILDALNEAFYLSFQNVEPTNKRTLLALDVSGSMEFYNISGMPITPRVASAAMAMVTARVESDYYTMGFSNTFVNLNISPSQRLDDVIRSIGNLPFSATDCAIPMIWALKNKIKVDTFVIYTDNETWYGDIHPSQALQNYRQKMGINAKLVVVAMISSKFSIADPKDPGMLDVVGFDTATPKVISEFSK